MTEFLNENNKYDLEERTGKFGESIIRFCQSVRQDVITRPIINQPVRSGTSIGANYMEANGASSKKILKTRFIFVKKKRRKLNIG